MNTKKLIDALCIRDHVRPKLINILHCNVCLHTWFHCFLVIKHIAGNALVSRLIETIITH